MAEPEYEEQSGTNEGISEILDLEPEDYEGEGKGKYTEEEGKAEKASGKFIDFFASIKKGVGNAVEAVTGSVKDNVIDPVEKRVNKAHGRASEVAKPIKKSAKSKANIAGHFIINVAERIEKKFRHKSGSSEAPSKDILFNIEKFKKRKETKAKKASEQAKKIEEESQKIAQADYLISSIDDDLKKIKQTKEDLQKQYEAEQDDELKNRLNDFDVDKEATYLLLERADKKAQALRSKDKEKKGEMFDYKQQALDEALKTKGLNDDQIRIIEAAKKQYKAQQVSEMGILEDIKQVIENYDKHYNEEIELSENVEGNSKNIIKDNAKKKYGTDAANDAASQKALERAKERAVYLKDNKIPLVGNDYVEMAFNEAKNNAEGVAEQSGNEPFEKQIEDTADRERILRIIGNAKELYEKEKGQIAENKRKKDEEEEKNFIEEEIVKKSLEALNKRREELEAAKKKYSDDPGMVKYYDDELQKNATQRAETALKTRLKLARGKQENEEEEQQLEADINEAKEKYKTAKAEAKAKEELEKAHKEAKALKAGAEAKAKSAGQTSGDSSASATQSDEETTDKNAKEEKMLNEFLNSITPKFAEQGKSSLAVLDDDDDEFDDDDDDEYDKKPEREENYKKSRKAIKYIRDVGDMRETMNLYIDNIKNYVSSSEIDKAGQGISAIRRIKERHKNRKNRSNQLQVIDNLQKQVDNHFNFHSVAIKKFEENIIRPNKSEKELKWDSHIPYIIEMSTLIDKLHRSLNYSYLQLSKDYPETADGIQDIMNKLHAPVFNKVAKAFLFSHKIKVKNAYGEIVKRGEEDLEINPFKNQMERNSYGSSRLRLSSSSSKNASAGICYMGALRTIINVCIAQKKLDAGSSGIAEKIIEKCKKTLGENAQDFSGNKLSGSIKYLKQQVLTNEQIRALGNNSHGTKQSDNADKLSDIMSLLENLSKNQTDSRTVAKIMGDLKEFNDFSDLGIGENSASKYTKRLYERGSNYNFMPEK